MTQAFDRSKFKATQVSATKQADQQVESLVRNKDFVSADFISFKDLGSGTYKFRIYPPHPADGGDQYAEAKAVHWLVVDKPEYKEGKPVFEKDGKTPVLKRGPKPFFNSRIHGGTEKDIIEQYILFAEKLAKENFPGDDAKQKEFLDPIYGGFNSKHQGIMVRLSWVMYVDLIRDGGSKTFGRLEIGKAIKQRLNQIAGVEGSNDPLGTDPFTDPSEGRAIIVKYDGQAKRAQDYYITDMDSSFDPKTKMINFYPLTDEDLEKFVKYPSLASMYKNTYKLKDFNQVMAGLKIFDDEHKVGVFQYDEFLDIAEKISQYYPEEEEKEEVIKEPVPTKLEVKGADNTSSSQLRHPQTPQREEDEFDQMDREELKEFCRENKTGIIVMNKMEDDVIRTKLREWYQATQVAPTPQPIASVQAPIQQEEEGIDEGDGLPWDKNGKEIAAHPAVKAKVEPKKSSTSSADRVAAIRKNLGKK